LSNAKLGGQPERRIGRVWKLAILGRRRGYLGRSAAKEFGSMAKRLPKTELLQEIDVERSRLDALLGQLTPRQMTQRDATLAGWSVKDILAHLIGWQQMNLDWYAAGQRGERPEIPALRDIGKLNDRIYRKHHRRSLNAVLADYSAFHQKILELIEEVPDRDFVAVGRFAWTGPSWTLSDYINANTASHYRWACKHIRKWLRAQTKANPDDQPPNQTMHASGNGVRAAIQDQRHMAPFPPRDLGR
jgi:hypothetical protein